MIIWFRLLYFLTVAIWKNRRILKLFSEYGPNIIQNEQTSEWLNVSFFFFTYDPCEKRSSSKQLLHLDTICPGILIISHIRVWTWTNSLSWLFHDLLLQPKTWEYMTRFSSYQYLSLNVSVNGNEWFNQRKKHLMASTY